jgi:putative ABC transport system ATP-binding protein
MFTLKDVSYKRILSVDNLTLSGPGITSIVGESGSGKTTLLRLLNKMISPEHGSIHYQGKSLVEIPSVMLRRSVVMLSQMPAIFPGTIRDNLLTGLLFAEKPPVGDNALQDVLTMVSLQKDLNGLAETLSGGEKQRLALARVILIEPEVMLLDEPSAALDEDTELLIIDKLATFAREHKKTLIMVTHAKQIARRYSDWIIEIRSGNIISQEEVSKHARDY